MAKVRGDCHRCWGDAHSLHAATQSPSTTPLATKELHSHRPNISAPLACGHCSCWPLHGQPAGHAAAPSHVLKPIIITCRPTTRQVPDYEDRLSRFERMCVVKAFREDRTLVAAADYISDALGQRFVESVPLSMEVRAAAAQAVRPFLSLGRSDILASLGSSWMCAFMSGAIAGGLLIPGTLGLRSRWEQLHWPRRMRLVSCA
jgi:hypothetical protein